MKHIDVAIRHQYDAGFTLDLAVQMGAQVTALFGPSGAGKSSILDAIAGTFRPTHGHVRFAGETWFDSDTNTFVGPERRHVGVVFQDQRLFPHLNVQKNLFYGAGTTRLPEDSELIEVLELGHQLRKLPSELSGGERQRVSLGRALLRRPRLLLLDEPFTGLDAALKRRIIQYLADHLERQRIQTVVVSHLREDVDLLASDVLTIANGRICEATSASISALNGNSSSTVPLPDQA
jgi:molybdate transport system ATP-binding protein